MYEFWMLYLIVGELAILLSLALQPRPQFSGSAPLMFACFLLLLPFWLPYVISGFIKQRRQP